MGPDYGKHVSQFYMFLASKICIYSLKLGVPASGKLNNYLVLTFTMCPKVPRTNKGHTGAHNVAIAAEKSRMES